MDERKAFLAAITASPDDDTPRLVFADWLQEHGEDERAEFIRVQCEIARLDQVDATCPFITEYSRPEPGAVPVERWTEGVCQCRGCVLVRRERELWDSAAQSMLRELPEAVAGLEVDEKLFADDHDFGVGIVGLLRRGFTSAVTCTADDWFDHATVIRESHPVRRVTLTTRPVIDGEYSDGILSAGFSGRDCAYRDFPQDAFPDDVVRGLLEGEFEGVEFDFPPIPPLPTLTVDGVTLEPGDVVLVLNQTDPADNGYREYLDRLTREIQAHIVNPMVAANFPGQIPPQLSFDPSRDFGPPPFRDALGSYRALQELGVEMSRQFFHTFAGVAPPPEPPALPPDPSA
jgi:uncharacterized protein (TIGR02996 family)